ncbi:sporulation-delaying protein SdpB family protein [Curtobacterium sp. GD1]|uniref:sporulation-delaying protein SdpB family protein n=1 Tax=Curtobacterium sp. GD1 TaxID=2810612 RepID=UPI001E4D2F6A|nr:sporulation-delaying protein SdpB family protein [Curtobacterium sp. GD1]MCC8907432.1 HTTM domain-containing protein [Curtobacterium sp. GD1]
MPVPVPWGASLSIARSLLFAGVALTLLVNPVTVLFTTSSVQPVAPVCDAYNAWTLFCIANDSLDLARVIAAVALILCATGFVPWLTAVPGAFLVLSFAMTTTLGDGGDQLYGILALLLVPVSITDWRLSSWRPVIDRRFEEQRAAIAVVGWFMIRAQIFIVYLEAAVGKLAVPEWANGTAMYYWLRSPTFGPGELLAPFVQFATSVPVIAALATFGTIALEFLLAIGPLIAARARPALLFLGLGLHGAIALLMGITSFSIVMAAALFLHLAPINGAFPALRTGRGDLLAPQRLAEARA